MASGSVNDPRARRAARIRPLEETLNGATGVMRNTLGEKQPEMMAQAVMRGVTVGWLSQVFRMDLTTVKARLKDCPPIDTRKNGYIYDLKLAAQYLVKPVVDIEEYLKTMKVEELPTRLQDQYWSAMNKRQKWEENAGQLWRTEKVQAAFGEVFLLIRNTMTLWVDQLARNVEVTEAQRNGLELMVEALQKEISEKIRALPKAKKTAPQLAELDDDEKPKKRGRPKKVTVDEDDDDLSDII